MLNDERGAGVVIVDDAVNVRQLRGPSQIDQGRRARGIEQGVSSKPGRGADDSLNPELEHLVQGLKLGLLALLAADDHRRVSAALHDGIKATDDLGQEQVVQIGDEHRDRVRAPADERPGRGIGPVAEFVDRAQHGCPPCLADQRRIVENARHERFGDARAGGDVSDRGPVHRALRRLSLTPAALRACAHRRTH